MFTLGKQPAFDDTLQELTQPLVDQSPSGSCLSMGFWVRFWWPDALPGINHQSQPAVD